MDRRYPIILLIEHDDDDRAILFRMLADRGYRIMAASRGADALDTFVFHHTQIALVLSNARLPDMGSAQLIAALHRIDPRVGVISARYPPQRLDGSDPSRSLAFVELIAEVDRRVWPASVDRYLSASRHGALSWPVRDEELDEIEGVDEPTVYPDPASPEFPAYQTGFGASELLESVAPPSDVLKSIKPRELRNYLAARSLARRSRLRLIARVAALVVILCAVAVTLLIQFRPTSARASEPIGSDFVVTSQLMSHPVSDRIGTMHLVPANRVSSANLADDTLRAARSAR